MATLGLHSEITLTHAWHQRLSLATERDFTIHVTEAAKFCCLMGLELGPLFQLHLHQPSVVDGFLHSLSFSLIPFQKLEA